MLKVISATEARKNLGSIIEGVAQGKSHFIIARRGKEKAVVIGVERYLELIDELEIIQEQQDPFVQKAL